MHVGTETHKHPQEGNTLKFLSKVPLPNSGIVLTTYELAEDCVLSVETYTDQCFTVMVRGVEHTLNATNQSDAITEAHQVVAKVLDTPPNVVNRGAW